MRVQDLSHNLKYVKTYLDPSSLSTRPLNSFNRNSNIPVRTGTAQDFCTLSEFVSSLFMMRLGLENVYDESRASSLYKARSSRLYSSPRADLTNLPSPPKRFTPKRNK
ncbi:unnamed protein product [Prunus armeniaca]